MKNLFKKLMSFLVVLPMVTSCSMYHSDASEKSELTGTYKLVTITKKHNENEDPYDYKSEIGAEAYFTLDINGYVYYAYKDNQTELNIKQAFAIYEPDFEDQTKYKSIKITDGSTQVSMKDKEVGCMDEPTLGFQNQKNKPQSFSYTIPSMTYTIFGHETVQPYLYAKYEKVSKECTLGYLNSLLGTHVSFSKPFEFKNISGFFAYDAQKKVEGTTIREDTRSNGIYEYQVIDISSYENGKVDLYYSLVEDPGMKVSKAEFFVEANPGYLNTLRLTVLGKEYYCYNYVNLGSSFSDNVIYNEEDEYTSQSFFKCGEETETIEEVLQNIGVIK